MRLDKEQEVCFLMIDLYCKKNHQGPDCPQCLSLKNYVAERLARCPYGNTKDFCSTCTTHCYRPDMKEQICTVMRFSGPRMLLHHPLVAFQHLYQTMGSKLRKK